MTRTWTMDMDMDMGRVHSEPVLGRRRQRGSGLVGVTRTKCLLNLPLCPTKPTRDAVPDQPPYIVKIWSLADQSMYNSTEFHCYSFSYI